MKTSCNQAESFIATRERHLTEIAEDYVEIALDVITLKGQAKVCDLAKRLGVSHVTVVRAIKRLRKKGYFEAQPAQPLILTEEGLRLALFCKQRHDFLLEYLMALGVSREVATIDVEGMEHHISFPTLEALQGHLDRIKKKNKQATSEA